MSDITDFIKYLASVPRREIPIKLKQLYRAINRPRNWYLFILLYLILRVYGYYREFGEIGLDGYDYVIVLLLLIIIKILQEWVVGDWRFYVRQEQLKRNKELLKQK